MSLVKAWDVAYVRFRAPDLGRMEAFLADFGMIVSDRSEDRLFMRGRGPAPFVHMTERGPPGFAGFGISLTSGDDLAALAAADGASVEPLGAPGGGLVVRLTDPDGVMVEVADVDDLMAGHAHLQAAGARAAWGVGRRLLGSQVFDYWLDPWGHEIEHWTDGDQLRAGDGGGVASIPDLIGVQWGMPMPTHPGVPASEAAQ